MAIRLARADDPQQPVLELGSSGQIGSPVARVHVADADKQRRSDVSPPLLPECGLMVRDFDGPVHAFEGAMAARGSGFAIGRLTRVDHGCPLIRAPIIFRLGSTRLGAFTTLRFHEVEKLLCRSPPIASTCHLDQAVEIFGSVRRQFCGISERVQALLAFRQSCRISGGESGEERVDGLDSLFVRPDLRRLAPPDKPTHEQHQTAGRRCEDRSFRCRDLLVGHSIISC